MRGIISKQNMKAKGHNLWDTGPGDKVHPSEQGSSSGTVLTAPRLGRQSQEQVTIQRSSTLLDGG